MLPAISIFQRRPLRLSKTLTAKAISFLDVKVNVHDIDLYGKSFDLAAVISASIDGSISIALAKSASASLVLPNAR
jgi:hypothetical protein